MNRAQNAKKRRTRLQRAWGRLWREWLRPLLPVVIVVATLRSAVADWNVVPSGSMEPNILIGDRIFVNKLAYGLRLPFTDWWLAQWNEPVRGEVAVMDSPADGIRLVKRVIGLPGDVVEMHGNRLWINGEPTATSAASADVVQQLSPEKQGSRLFVREETEGHPHTIALTPGVPSLRTFGPITVPAEHFFVMGDNRDRSKDSRVFGFVPRENIVGRSSWVVISLNYDRSYLPRWGRFFSSLP